jgi:hypothetical protein
MTLTSIDIEKLTTVGLLPENLPAAYTTKNIWAPYAPHGDAYIVTKLTIGEHAIYNASKRGGQRRIFGIPHPAFVRDIAVFCNKHWSDVSKIIEGSPGSLSKPILHPTGPRYVGITPHTDLPKRRLKAFSRFKFCLLTDVSRFYPSTYTHTLPWALHGKVLAKKDFQITSAKVFGNRLDFILRQSQDKQTVGIPIGPDTSKIVSELLMAAVDREFMRRSGKKHPIFLRHVDDYWVGGNSVEECDKHLQNLRGALREFELDINEVKTRIISTKFIFGDSWPFEFDREIRDSLSPMAKVLDADPVATLSKIVDRATRDNDDGLIRHIIRKIDESHLWSSDWELLEHFLAQCAVQFSHSFDYVARVIAWRRRTKRSINATLWRDVAKLTAVQNAAVGRDSEVLWSLWLIKELGVKIPKATTDLIVANNGALVLAFLAHCAKHKVASDNALQGKLCSVVEGNPFAGAYWPLTLELTHLGMADPAWSVAPGSPPVRALHNAHVSIIDWDAPPKVFASEDPDMDDDDDPSHAIEDFGSDYEDNADESNDKDDDVIAF